MSDLPDSMPSPSSLLQSLRTFASSPADFQILHRVGACLPDRSVVTHRPQTLFVLDSSFNPPTIAHRRICLSALQDEITHGPRTLLLLLATQNADKPAKPAAFVQRLAMMGLLGQDLHAQEPDVAVDIAVCKTPLFVDKVHALAQTEEYGEDAEQVHLIGFDTIVRLLDPKYYPPEHSLKPLQTLFARHKVRVTKRTDADSSDKEQEDYIANLSELLESRGGSKMWADRIKLTEGRRKDEKQISSTSVREAAQRKQMEELRSLVPSAIASWIEEHDLYSEG